MRHLPKAQVQRLARARSTRAARSLAAFDRVLDVLRGLGSNIHVFRDPVETQPLKVYRRVRPDGITEYAILGDPAAPLDWFSIPGDPAAPLDWFRSSDPKGK